MADVQPFVFRFKLGRETQKKIDGFRAEIEEIASSTASLDESCSRFIQPLFLERLLRILNGLSNDVFMVEGDGEIAITESRESDSGHISVLHAEFHKNGFFMEVPDAKESFWMFLGPIMGWGRFGRTCNRLTGAPPELFELVEVQRREPSPCQGPRFWYSNVLWHRREAILAKLSISSYLQDSGSCRSSPDTQAR